MPCSDLDGLLHQIIDHCFAILQHGAAPADLQPSREILADWLEEHGCSHLACLFRDPLADHEAWTLDLLTGGPHQAETWAREWGLR